MTLYQNKQDSNKCVILQCKTNYHLKWYSAQYKVGSIKSGQRASITVLNIEQVNQYKWTN